MVLKLRCDVSSYSPGDVGPEVSYSKSEAAAELEVVHPWAEWVELMERLVQRNYFDDSRKDEHIMVQVMGFDASEVSPAGDDCEVFVETGYSKSCT
ncbi:hypothetical protein OROGR_023031 [Orobanche gracilis]